MSIFPDHFPIQNNLLILWIRLYFYLNRSESDCFSGINRKGPYSSQNSKCQDKAEVKLGMNWKNYRSKQGKKRTFAGDFQILTN